MLRPKCKECGSLDVDTAEWVSWKTGKPEVVGTEPALSHGFCHECECECEYEYAEAE